MAIVCENTVILVIFFAVLFKNTVLKIKRQATHFTCSNFFRVDFTKFKQKDREIAKLFQEVHDDDELTLIQKLSYRRVSGGTI